MISSAPKLSNLLRCIVLLFPIPFAWHQIETHPNLQLDPLVLSEYSLHFEVDTNSADEGRGEGIVSVPEEEGGLAHRAVPDDEQLEHVVEVLVGCVFLP